jgi:small subunit ribosomal protein S18
VAKQRNRKPVRRRDKKGGPSAGRRKSCPYCKDKIEHVDYKDVEGLRRFISEKGKIRSRRDHGAVPSHQARSPAPSSAPRARAAAVRQRGRRPLRKVLACPVAVATRPRPR